MQAEPDGAARALDVPHCGVPRDAALPRPIGELLSRELLAHEEFGRRISNDSLLTRVRDTIDKEWHDRGCPE